MKPTYVVALALLLFVIGRWAHKKTPVLDVQMVAGGVVLLVVIALLENPRTYEIAAGFAWIILAVVALSPDSPVTAIANVINRNTRNTPAKGGTTSA